MKHLIILILCVISFSSCNSQEKETIYLLFHLNDSVTCNYSIFRDGRDKKEMSFKYRKNIMYKTNIVFEICTQFFVFDPKVQSKKIIKNTNLNIVTIDYLLNKSEEEFVNKNSNFGKKTAFKQIYIIEKLNDNEYIRYEVVWKDMHISEN